ncbi:hypothetical protein K1719_035478 [Acacia pycnantha]|nr:hypothetical protein K1719_035478 [Acacia pycnantha]
MKTLLICYWMNCKPINGLFHQPVVQLSVSDELKLPTLADDLVFDNDVYNSLRPLEIFCSVFTNEIADSDVLYNLYDL